MDRGVEEVLTRLVAQFASPYDFVRELVQNAMDGGAERLDVIFDAHVDADGGFVHELRFEDAGRGMTQAVVREELTRLFASSKTGDRTAVGEFGVGFVSVFAWQPDAVLLQTGREGEAWELLFDGSATFEERALEFPVEGTTIVLFRRGDAEHSRDIARAVLASLTRWCRHCPLDLTFEDRVHHAAPVSVCHPFPHDDAICEAEVPMAGGCMTVALCDDPRVVFMRGGLILREGPIDEVFAPLARRLPEVQWRHVRICIDSSELQTTIARDVVLGGPWMDSLATQAVTALEELRAQLFALASSGADKDASADTYAHAMAHLTLAAQLGGDAILDELGRRPLLSVHHLAAPTSARALVRGLRGLPLLVAAASTSSMKVPTSKNAEGPGDWSCDELPVVRASIAEDLPWLRTIARCVDTGVVSASRALLPIEPRLDVALGLCGGVQALLASAGISVAQVRLANFDVPADPMQWLAGFEVPSSGPGRFACVNFGSKPAARLHQMRLWLRADHPTVVHAMKLAVAAPLEGAMAVVLGLWRDLRLDGGALTELGSAVERGDWARALPDAGGSR